MSEADWVKLGRHVWHPYTQMQTAPLPIPVARAEGVYLITADGRRILDGISSWWVNIHGHNHPRLNKALARQAERVAQVIFAGFIHEPAARLADELVRRSPAGLNRVFFSDDGSTAVEVALKMAYQYWHNRGETERRLFVALDNAYHGDTFGAMAAGGVATFHAAFGKLLFDVRRARAPRCKECPIEGACARCGQSASEDLAVVLEREGHRVAGVIVEPMVQGAGGMIVWPPDFLRYVADCARTAGVPLIADEVFTGFGRTGGMWAVDHGPITPDIMCLSKAITAGYLPLGATLCTDRIYDAFLSDDRNRTLFHGHSYTGNALACAVALESLALFDDTDCLSRVGRLERQFRSRMAGLAELPIVRNPRVLGGLAALTVGTDEPAGYLDPIGPRLHRQFLERDILLRPLGNVLYFLPPYAIDDAEVDRVFDVITEVLGAL